MDISKLLSSANERLKAGLIPCRIEVNKNFLSLRATLPPKPGSNKVKPYQQRIYIHLPANELGVKEAEKEARLVGSLLIKNEFDWHRYIPTKFEQTETLTVGYWCKKFEKDYFDRIKKNGQSLTTWKTEYLAVFRRLPKDEVISTELLKQIILSTEPDTRTRKRFCMVLTAFSKFAGIGCDFSKFKGSYSSKSVEPRTLPTDKEIIELFFSIENNEWRWVFGAIATFGLRNHEVFRLDLSLLKQNGLAYVTQGKTGSRVVYPYYPEWVTIFDLKNIKLPRVNLSRHDSEVGHEVTQFFSRHNLGKPYNLRHAWAVRTIGFKLEPSIAAKQMGHSLQVHTNLYHRWMDSVVHQKAWNESINSPSRPRSPLLPSKPSK